MQFAGETLLLGTVLRVEPDGALGVRLDDGSEIPGVLNNLGLTFYKLVPGERVCVSVVKGKSPTLTGFLAHRFQPWTD